MGHSFSRQVYARGAAGEVGVPTNASWTGPWIPINRNGSVTFKVVMAGTDSPVGTWGADVTDDDAPNASGGMGATPLTLTAAQAAQNPVGDAANINFAFQFNPAPDAKFMRFNFTRASGGSASRLLKVSVAANNPGGS
jgi:hypothetical protein